MEVDKERIKEKFVDGEKYIDAIKQILENTRETYAKSFNLQLQGERAFEVISQLFIDVCTHIISRTHGAGPPKSYGDCMRVLERLGVIQKEDTNRYIQLIKMRNRIIHIYGGIDANLVYDALTDIIKDFAKYKSSVLAWLDRS
ncbi:MAG: DUF86 domain-containing protein [Candidatus Sigynarchaeota archaeon]